MSEKLHNHKSNETSNANHESYNIQEKKHINSSELDNANKQQSEVNLHKIREHAKTLAEEGTKSKLESYDKVESTYNYSNQQEIKNTAYEQTLKDVQKKLSKPSESFSKIVHNKTIEKISDIGASTIARPSGMLGGSIVAFSGSLVLLYASRSYGFSYNYLLFAVLFVAGYLLGAFIELVLWSLRHKKNRYND